MPMEKKFRLILLKKRPEHLKPLMGQIHPVIELVRRRMSHQNIEPPMPEQLKPKLPHPVLHLPLRILEFPGAVSHRPSKPKDTHPLMDINLIINANAPVRRNLLVFLIVVPVYIQDRHGRKSRQERKILSFLDPDRRRI